MRVYRVLVSPRGTGEFQGFIGVVRLRPGIRIGFRVGFLDMGCSCGGLYLRERRAER